MCGRVVKYQFFFDSFVWVNQGKPLSPVLLILFLNDLADDLRVQTFDDSTIEDFQKFILLFAEDTFLMANDVIELQTMLNRLSVYCKKWNITVNVNKTKVMLFKSSSRPEQFEILYDGSVLENVRNFIYLGVNISCTGIFYQAQKHLSEQASKAFYSLSNLFTDSVLSVQVKIRVFDALIQPIITYDSEI